MLKVAVALHFLFLSETSRHFQRCYRPNHQTLCMCKTVTVLLYKEQPFHIRVRFANIRISGGQVQDIENSESRYPVSQKQLYHALSPSKYTSAPSPRVMMSTAKGENCGNPWQLCALATRMPKSCEHCVRPNIDAPNSSPRRLLVGGHPADNAVSLLI